MPSVYLVNVTGDGLTPETAHRPNVTTTLPWAALMVDEAKAKAVIVAQDDTLSGAGITKLITGATLAALRTAATTTNPTAAQRTAINTWLTNNSYQTLTAAQTTWAQCIHFVARQVNPVADLALTGAG